MKSGTPHEIVNRTESMEKYLKKARGFSEDGHFEECLNNIRKFLEAALKELGEKYECESESRKYWVKVTINNLQNHIPDRLFYYLEHIQRMGNYGSHFQGDGVEPSKEDAEYCVYAGNEIYQLINPPVIENEAPDFIKIMFEAVDCPTCDSKKGVRCKAIREYRKEEWEGEHDKAHAKRGMKYTEYRREFQKGYNTTISQAMQKISPDVNQSLKLFQDGNALQVIAGS